MSDAVAECLGRWWMRESRVLAISQFVSGLVQLGIAAFIAAIGVTVVATVFMLVLSPLQGVLGSNYIINATAGWLLVTFVAYPFLRQRSRGYLISDAALKSPVRVPASLFIAEQDPFDSGVRANRFKIVGAIVFALPVAFDRVYEAVREAAILLRPMAGDVGRVLALLVEDRKPLPFTHLAENVPGDWSRLLRRLALLPGLQLLPKSGDALALGEKLRLRLVEALNIEGVAFDVVG